MNFEELLKIQHILASIHLQEKIERNKNKGRAEKRRYALNKALKKQQIKD